MVEMCPARGIFLNDPGAAGKLNARGNRPDRGETAQEKTCRERKDSLLQTHLEEESLVRANAQFWEQMLGMQMETVPLAREYCVGAGHVLASVNLSGMWKGRIEVRMAMDLANAATAAMLMQPVDEVVEADTLDATREIVNMIAGLLKSSLPQPCSMTVPESAIATERLCSRLYAEDTLTVAFRHAIGGLLVRVRQEANVH
jgi:chemotaxis protein CheX